MALQIELDVRRAEAGPVYLAEIAASARHLDAAGVPRRVKRVGDPAPDFALMAADGTLVTLSRLLRSGPVVISFYRGEWCPFCEAELEAVMAAQPEIGRAGASLLLISPEPPSADLAAAVARLGEGVYLLQDRMLGVALQYGLVYLVPKGLRDFYLGRDFDLSRVLSTGSWLLALPADFVIGPDGVIAVAYVEPDFTRRLDPAAVVGMLEHRTS